MKGNFLALHGKLPFLFVLPQLAVIIRDRFHIEASKNCGSCLAGSAGHENRKVVVRRTHKRTTLTRSRQSSERSGGSRRPWRFVKFVSIRKVIDAW